MTKNSAQHPTLDAVLSFCLFAAGFAALHLFSRKATTKNQKKNTAVCSDIMHLTNPRLYGRIVGLATKYGRVVVAVGDVVSHMSSGKSLEDAHRDTVGATVEII